MSLTVGSLFAGIGGFDLAAEWMGWRTIWFSEIDPYCCQVLHERFPGVPNLGDITRIAWDGVAVPDVLCGGFPCQDISSAGKRAGIRGERSGLWSEYARAIRELQPRYVVVENVRALLVRGIDVVLGELADLGYDAEWEVLSAADVGAPHLRERIWVVAYPACERSGETRGLRRARSTEWLASGDEALSHAASEGQQNGDMLSGVRGDAKCADERQVLAMGNPLADTIGQRGRGGYDERENAADVDAPGERSRPRDGREWWATEPRMGRLAHGVPSRVGKLRALGNAIVPQCAVEGPFRRIQDLEAEGRTV